MRNAFLLICLFCISMVDAQVTVSWFNYPGGVSVATDATDNVYTANWDYNPAGDITLTKRDANGNILWNTGFNNTNTTLHEVATWVDIDNAGNILVSGTIRSGYSNPVNASSLLMKFSPSGVLIWRVVYESSFDGSYTRKCLVDANNNIYVLGVGTGPSGQVTKVKKFNSSGISVWNYFDAGIGGPITFKFTPDNKILIVHRGVTGSFNAYSKIDLNGNNIWSTSGIASLSVGDAAGDAFGNTFIINGLSTGSELKKLSPTGGLIWSKTNTINGNKVEVGTDNNAVVGGYPGAGYGVAILKYDSNGGLLWQNLDADGPALSLLALAPMRLDALNAVYVAGSTMSQMGLCKVNSNGTSAWAAATSSGYPVYFDFGTDNSVYVTGGTTAKFTQTGAVPIPAAPTNLNAIASNTTINLSWTDNATNETGYVLQRSLSSGTGFSTIVTLPANSVSYSNSGLLYSTTYFYRVQAINVSNTSTWSNIANATTAAAPLTIPLAPSNLTAVSNGCRQIKLNWVDHSNNETGFQIRRATSISGTYSTIATVGSNITSFTNTALGNNKRYYYKIRSTNSMGSSSFSNIADALTSCGALISKNEMNDQITIAPNPVVNNQFKITFPVDTEFPVTADVFSPIGQKVLSKELNKYSSIIQTDGFGKGLFLIQLRSKSKTEVLKIMIN